MKVSVDICVDCPAWETALPGLESLARRAVAACLEQDRERLRAAPNEIMRESREAEVSLLFCDDREIRRLNAAWRKQDKATNVLSFPTAASAPGAVRLLGDVALAFETVQAEASAEGKTIASHAAHLIVHGVLHLIGYDHETDSEAELMEARERQTLAQLGLADPYGAYDDGPP